MSRSLLGDAIGIAMVIFLAACYRGFARTGKELKMRGSSAVHPFSNLDPSRTSNVARRSLVYGLLVATILTASVYEQFNRQSARKLELQIQQLQNVVNQLQSRIDSLEKKNKLDRPQNAPTGAAAVFFIGIRGEGFEEGR